MKTLALRMERHQENAFRVARFLQEHRAVRQVYYPGLPDDPGHLLAQEQMSGYGGMVMAKDTETPHPKGYGSGAPLNSSVSRMGVKV